MVSELEEIQIRRLSATLRISMEENGAVSGSTSNRNETGNREGSPAPALEAASGAGGIEETSPDLLKNTPSNIARLKDAIEQCEGRHKYLAHTRSPSDGRDVRWYFCKVPLAENGKLLLTLTTLSLFLSRFPLKLVLGSLSSYLYFLCFCVFLQSSLLQFLAPR